MLVRHATKLLGGIIDGRRVAMASSSRARSETKAPELFCYADITLGFALPNVTLASLRLIRLLCIHTYIHTTGSTAGCFIILPRSFSEHTYFSYFRHGKYTLPLYPRRPRILNIRGTWFVSSSKVSCAFSPAGAPKSRDFHRVCKLRLSLKTRTCP